MTGKLKTLKDLCYNLRIENEDGSLEDEPCDGVVRESKLKSEAVKYIKYYRSLYPHNVQGASQVQWIKHFFNLTEEDLK